MIYRAFAANAFLTRLAYRTQVWALLLGGLVRVFAVIAIWHAVFPEGDTVAGVTLPEMVTYAILASSVLSAYHWERLVQAVDRQIRSGDITVFLLKPLNYPLMLLAGEIGEMGFRALTVTLPITLIAALTYGLTPPASAFHGLIFPAFWALSFALLFLMALIAGLAAFWLMTAFSLEWFLTGLISLLSGTFIPLWFFPEGVAAVIQYLPFAWIGFHPMAVWLGKVSVTETLTLLALGLAWAGALTLLAGFLWTRAQRRLTVQGG